MEVVIKIIFLSKKKLSIRVRVWWQDTLKKKKMDEHNWCAKCIENFQLFTILQTQYNSRFTSLKSHEIYCKLTQTWQEKLKETQMELDILKLWRLRRWIHDMMYQVLESKAMMVLRFIGFMYRVEPVMICCTIILFAFSDGWNGSQNA